MKTFKQYILNEVATTGKKFTFGSTAFGLETIDKVTASDQKKANAKVPGYEGFNQRVGSSGREYIPAYSVASRTLPAGTMIKITDRRTGSPVGAQFGNTQGIYRVDGTGGPQTKNNIDFFSGDNKEMFDYYASIGVNSNNLEVEVLNIAPGSEEEKQILANIGSTQQPNSLEQEPKKQQPSYYASPADAASGLAQGLGLLGSAIGGGMR